MSQRDNDHWSVRWPGRRRAHAPPIHHNSSIGSLHLNYFLLSKFPALGSSNFRIF